MDRDDLTMADDSLSFVTPAKAGVHSDTEPRAAVRMDASFRWHDDEEAKA
jgi:hypothetical protein